MAMTRAQRITLARHRRRWRLPPPRQLSDVELEWFALRRAIAKVMEDEPI